MKKALFLIALIAIFDATSAFAQDELHKAVDRRYRFSKHLQSEVNVYGGDFLGDASSNSWDVGAQYFLHLNNTFAVGASYMYSPIYVDWNSYYGKSIKDRKQHFINGALMIANDAAFRAGKGVIECDLYLTLGVGALQINDYYKPLGIIGGGLKVYTGLPWLAVRFDVNSYIHPTPKPNGDSINADIAMNGGVSFLFPVRRIEQEEQDSQ